MTKYNPIFNATRAAWSELTTPEAGRWYKRQLQSTKALTHQGLTLVRHWLSASRRQVSAVEPVQVSDSTGIEPTRVSAPSETTTTELGDIPAGWAAIEANSSIAVPLSEQAITGAEAPAPAADLAPEPEPSALATPEPGATPEYEMLDDWQEPPTETGDEPLLDVAILNSDELESGPPFLPEEEDDSFFGPDEDDSDSLQDDLEPSASVLPADLSARVEAYLQSHDISVEAEDSASLHHSPTLASNYGSTEPDFGE